MNKTILTSILVWLLPLLAKTQLIFHGSYFIAAICPDGILIGTDSRQSLGSPFSTAPQFVAFYDTSQKIYPMGKYAMALMGNATSLSDTNWRYFYIKEFRKYLIKQNLLELDIDYFFDFLKNRYPKAYSDFLGNVLVFASYNGTKPVICATNRDEKLCISDSGYISLDKQIHFETTYNYKDSCKKMVKNIETAILGYAEKNKLTDIIGGLIMVLKISPNNELIWLTPKPIDEGYCNFKEFMKAESEGRVKSVYKVSK